MVAQTVLPLRWVIVSDGSTDGTDDIVGRYQPGRPWLELVKLPPRTERNFAAKVNAFRAGLRARARTCRYDVIGNVDADVSFAADYFEFLLGKFEAMPELGVAGTHYVEGDFHSFDDSYINVHHVNGRCQLFRRALLRGDRRLQPIKGGGIDWVAVTTRAHEGMADLLLRRTGVPSPPQDGHRRRQRAAGAVSLREEGLLPRRPPAVAARSQRCSR